MRRRLFAESSECDFNCVSFESDLYECYNPGAGTCSVQFAGPGSAASSGEKVEQSTRARGMRSGLAIGGGSVSSASCCESMSSYAQTGDKHTDGLRTSQKLGGPVVSQNIKYRQHVFVFLPHAKRAAHSTTIHHSHCTTDAFTQPQNSRTNSTQFNRHFAYPAKEGYQS